jgi:prepilin-type N-terminal cleavage/methylation domain-containing protein
MRRFQSIGSSDSRRGFTLVELMLATVVGTIVMMAIVGLMAGYWRTTMDFIRDEQTIQEISFLSKLFRDNSRELPSIVEFDPHGSDYVDFLLPDTTSRIYYDKPTKGVKFDPDASSGNDGEVMLSKSIVNDVFSVITGDNLIGLDVMILDISGKFVRTNNYRMYSYPRNIEHSK